MTQLNSNISNVRFWANARTYVANAGKLSQKNARQKDER